MATRRKSQVSPVGSTTMYLMSKSSLQEEVSFNEWYPSYTIPKYTKYVEQNGRWAPNNAKSITSENPETAPSAHRKWALGAGHHEWAVDNLKSFEIAPIVNRKWALGAGHPKWAVDSLGP